MDTAPLEIIKTISKMPPYLQREAEKGYIGLGCTWIVLFQGVRNPYNDDNLSPNNELYHITMLDINGSYPWIYGEVLLNKYPVLKTLHEGRKLKISGKIQDVDKHTITLDDLEIIEFIDESKSTYEDTPRNKGVVEGNEVNLPKRSSFVYIKKNILAIIGILVGVMSIPWWPTWWHSIKNLL